MQILSHLVLGYLYDDFCVHHILKRFLESKTKKQKLKFLVSTCKWTLVWSCTTLAEKSH